jgi:transcriptional regulator with XRE-family HTH domain
MGSLERGERNLTLKTLMTVAQALGMTVAELLKGIV